MARETVRTPSNPPDSNQERVRQVFAEVLLGDSADFRGKALSTLDWLGKEKVKDALLAVILSLGDWDATVRVTACEVLCDWYPQLEPVRQRWRTRLAGRRMAAHVELIREAVEHLPEAQQALKDQRPGWQMVRFLTVKEDSRMGTAPEQGRKKKERAEPVSGEAVVAEVSDNSDSTPLYWDGPSEAFDATSLDEETRARRKVVLESVVPAMIESGNRAFESELAELREHYPSKWVAYHGRQRIGVADSETELWQRCLRRGLKEGSFVTRLVPPEHQGEETRL
jgi:hypothetical protein